MPELQGYIKYLKNDNLLQWAELYEAEEKREFDEEEQRWRELLEKDPEKMIRPEKERLIILLRAKDFSFTEIAQRVQLSRPTVISIVRKYANSIAMLSRLELQELKAMYQQTVKRKLKVFGGVLGRLLEELQGRDLSELPTDRLLDLILKYNKAISDSITDKAAGVPAIGIDSGEETELNNI